MVAYKQKYEADELDAAKEQVKVLRSVYRNPVWLIRWDKDCRGKQTAGLYIGIGDSKYLPAFLQLDCITTTPIKV